MIIPVRVQSGREEMAARLMKRFVNEIRVLPVTHRVIGSNGDEKGEVLFSGYVFIEAEYSADLYHALKKIPFVFKVWEGIHSLSLDEIDHINELLNIPEVELSELDAALIGNAIEEIQNQPAVSEPKYTKEQVNNILTRIRKAITKPVIIGKRFRTRLRRDLLDLLREWAAAGSLVPVLLE